MVKNTRYSPLLIINHVLITTEVKVKEQDHKNTLVLKSNCLISQIL
jgi:hypothetical protein